MNSPLRHAGSVFRKGRPIQLTFFLTRRCNGRCPFCFYLASRSRKPPGSPELSLDEIEKVADSLDRLLWVLFSGGEVYLREDLVEICHIFHRNNRVAIITLPTNGLLPELVRERTEEILRRCREAVVVVKLSMDGVGEEHDALRRVGGSFEKVMETYKGLLGLLPKYGNLELGINTVFFSENQHQMSKSNGGGIIDFVQGLEGIGGHTISMVRGDLQEERYKDIDLTQYHEVIVTLEKRLHGPGMRRYRFRGGRMKSALDILQRRLIYQTMRQKRRVIPCYAGRLNLVLTESGDLYSCELSSRCMGNVRDSKYDVKSMLRSAEARETIAQASKGHCYCSHECNFTMNILFNPKMYPKLLQIYWQLRARTHHRPDSSAR